VRHWPGGVPGVPGWGPAIRMTSVAVASMGRQGRTDSAAARRAWIKPGMPTRLRFRPGRRTWNFRPGAKAYQAVLNAPFVSTGTVVLASSRAA